MYPVGAAPTASSSAPAWDSEKALANGFMAARRELRNPGAAAAAGGGLSKPPLASECAPPSPPTPVLRPVTLLRLLLLRMWLSEPLPELLPAVKLPRVAPAAPPAAGAATVAAAAAASPSSRGSSTVKVNGMPAETQAHKYGGMQSAGESSATERCMNKLGRVKRTQGSLTACRVHEGLEALGGVGVPHEGGVRVRG